MYEFRGRGFNFGRFAVFLGVMVCCSLAVWTFLASAGLTARGASAQSATYSTCSWDNELSFITEDPSWSDQESSLISTQTGNSRWALTNTQPTKISVEYNTETGSWYLYNTTGVTFYSATTPNSPWNSPASTSNSYIIQYNNSTPNANCISFYGYTDNFNWKVDSVPTNFTNFRTSVRDGSGFDMLEVVDQSVTLPVTNNEQCEWWNFNCWLGRFNPVSVFDTEAFEKKLGFLYQGPEFLISLLRSFSPETFLSVDKNSCSIYPTPSGCFVRFPLPFQGDRDSTHTVPFNIGEWRNIDGNLGRLFDLGFLFVGFGVIVSLSNRLYQTIIEVTSHGS